MKLIFSVEDNIGKNEFLASVMLLENNENRSIEESASEIEKRVNAYDEMKSREGMMRSQIAEAIAIMESGTAYEKAHVVGILKAAIKTTEGEPT